MPTDRINPLLKQAVADRVADGTSKGSEDVIRGHLVAEADRGPRVLLEGEDAQEFIRMNSNDYLGLSWDHEIAGVAEAAVGDFSTGPGAVRFISGTWKSHVDLESRLAHFHGRESAMVFSSAYATVMSVLPALVSPETAILSDELNHNCIINAIRLAQPSNKQVYAYLDMEQLEASLCDAVGRCRRAVIVTDGVFSMRGDHAPLDKIVEIARRHDSDFEENVIVVVDDSHGVGVFGQSGRGTEEVCDDVHVDVLVGTLGKAFGVNGGYVVGDATLTDYLREVAPFYIYSNSIGPGEAAAATASVSRVDSESGLALIRKVQESTQRLKARLDSIGYETIPGRHPVVAVMIRDTERTNQLVAWLRSRGILATGLSYPVVPRAEDEIRLQINAGHTDADIESVISAFGSFPK